MGFWQDKLEDYGPGASGALFGAGWWFWVDAIVCSHHKVPAGDYVPGFIATLALIMINCVRRDELQEYDPFDDGSDCRSRSWLFVSYVVSFSSVVAAVWVLVQNYATNPEIKGDEIWPGVAGVIQCTLILASGLIFWLSRSPAGGGGAYGGY
mmetsp:Transcript_54449/g.173018  ORF Transcript_54449/g.173018 Transcript_54449/m.173018 type:complete len:152 (+) Transcript_54449:276-731(+)